MKRVFFIFILCAFSVSAAPYRIYFSASGLIPYMMYDFGCVDVPTPDGSGDGQIWSDSFTIQADANGNAVRVCFVDADYDGVTGHYIAAWAYDFDGAVGAGSLSDFDFSGSRIMYAAVDENFGYTIAFTLFVEPVGNTSSSSSDFLSVSKSLLQYLQFFIGGFFCAVCMSVVFKWLW